MLQKKVKILLIENDEMEIFKFKRALSSKFSDFTIIFANNGKEALSILENCFPDIILLDLNMPDINGFDFLTNVKNLSQIKHIPIIVLTTSNNINDIKKCYKLGIAGYLLKSLNDEDYLIKINKIMKYWSVNDFIRK
ncbi:Response regulator receiver domain-containing protein [Polaribacter sp. KT25b]|uniref:response regulator n=1 Tax=Polaribacter sp. KT25b TaxID=1855336 RepID=UPI00087A7C99|nr:response regulator [Polaribacter sp. KT25b]SDS06899.1 Response regulator receiver domain-containing protein [Polaribacter sp. KT25b]